jgi:hypothetical protein
MLIGILSGPVVTQLAPLATTKLAAIADPLRLATAMPVTGRLRSFGPVRLICRRSTVPRRRWYVVTGLLMAPKNHQNPLL